MSNDYKMSEIRFAAHKKAKYLSQITFGLVPVCKPGIGTMAVDQHGRLYYDPEFLHEGQDLEELAGVFVHECMHIVLNHAKRRKISLGDYPDQSELYDWNVACDAAINDSLTRQGIRLPEDGVFPDKLGLPKNKTAEWYYDEIHKEPEDGGGGGGSCHEEPMGGDPGGEEPGGGTPQPPGPKGGGGVPQQSEPGDPAEEGDYTGPPLDRSKGEGGSGADGVDREWELGEPTEESVGMSEYDIERLRRQTLEEMKSSVSRGALAGDMQAAIDQILEPKVNPLAELRALVKYSVNSSHGFGEHTYKKRNPRQPKGALRIPAHRQPRPIVKIIVDTSGSMGERDLALALGTVQQAVSHLQTGVEVIAADVDVRSCQKVFKADQVVLAGRGGTDMSKAMESVMEMQPSPDVLIVVTDGETPWPEKEMNVKCVAALTRHSSYHNDPPGWIKTVKLEVDDG